ncbi:hypothetical protein GCM10020369_66510 [Cryptosporangium minutisporangium]|uniref:Uncharacterized protein n=1 Tax=Cryptosporangium minutisporangium TaxID=113569 RepID=A0ABP6T802_9ACTN
MELDGVKESLTRLPAPGDFDIRSGPIGKGTAAALRFEVRGMRNGRAVCALEHITRLRPDLRPDWPQPTSQGGYRVVVTDEPSARVPDSADI